MSGQYCPTCGSLLRLKRDGVVLSPMKAAIYDAVLACKDEGIAVDDLLTLQVFTERSKRATRFSVKAHVWQINEAMAAAGVGRRIISIGRRYVLVTLPKAEAAE